MVIEPVQLGPCVIGEDCQFDPGVYLAYPRGTPRCRRRNDFEETILGRGCRVRSNCVIYRHSALGDRCQVAHNVVVREHVTVGDGCVRIAMVAACGPRVPDLVVGIGGGSSLDAAKLLMVLTEAPEIDLGEHARPFSLPPVRRRCRLALLPTTAGSGSEASSAALVTLGDPPRKVPIVSHDLLPDLAILDPELLAGIPAPVLAAGLVDAVTHAVEGYLSRIANPLADALAEKALQMVGEGFPLYQRDPEDPQWILTLQMAAYLAGLVQNLEGVGASHALAHQLSRLGIGHGTANGLCLPAVLAAHRAHGPSAERLARLERAAGLARIEDLLADLQEWGGLPRSLAVSIL